VKNPLLGLKKPLLEDMEHLLRPEERRFGQFGLTMSRLEAADVTRETTSLNTKRPGRGYRTRLRVRTRPPSRKASQPPSKEKSAGPVDRGQGTGTSAFDRHDSSGQRSGEPVAPHQRAEDRRGAMRTLVWLRQCRRQPMSDGARRSEFSEIELRWTFRRWLAHRNRLVSHYLAIYI
jgi:hypothetical protein